MFACVNTKDNPSVHLIHVYEILTYILEIAKIKYSRSSLHLFFFTDNCFRGSKKKKKIKRYLGLNKVNKVNKILSLWNMIVFTEI